MISFIAACILALIGAGIAASAVRMSKAKADYDEAMEAYVEKRDDYGRIVSGNRPKDPEISDANISSVRMAYVLVATIAMALMAFACVSVVGATSVGVPVTFGTVGSPLASGWHLKSPVTRVNKLPTRPVTVELGDENSDWVKAATNQAGSYTVGISARWATDPVNANKLFKQARSGDEDNISKNIVAKSLRQAVNDVYAGFTNVDANSRRGAISGLVRARLQVLMTPYGITIDDVNLRSSDPDGDTKAAIASFAAEQQKTKVAEQAKLTAVQDAATRLAIATGIAKAAEQTKGLSAQEQDSVCISTWERAVKDAASHGVVVNTTPCGDSKVNILSTGGK